MVDEQKLSELVKAETEKQLNAMRQEYNNVINDLRAKLFQVTDENKKLKFESVRGMGTTGSPKYESESIDPAEKQRIYMKRLQSESLESVVRATFGDEVVDNEQAYHSMVNGTRPIKGFSRGTENV